MTDAIREPATRHSLRLAGYEYTRAGAYFVTICIRERVCLLGDIVDGVMRLSPIGQIAQDLWQTLPERFPPSHA
ncbi:MAG TPA: hypothetical protein VFB58_06105 [Chloroflexota bacterium]|nr:hypothetical protein [Chloroflexota bacterium]